MKEVIENYKANTLNTLRSYKGLAERALQQISDEQLFEPGDPESNSIAIIMKHIVGNQRSRFTDFLTTDGEKPDRNRDTEFTEWEVNREELLRNWESSWNIVFNAIEGLSLEDFGREVAIRGEVHTVVEAINRQLSHYAYHVGQIVFRAKQLKSDSWESLSVPRGASEDFNRFLAERRAAGEEQLEPLEGTRDFMKKGTPR